MWRGDGDSDALNFVFFKIILDLIWGLEGDTVAGVDSCLPTAKSDKKLILNVGVYSETCLGFYTGSLGELYYLQVRTAGSQGDGADPDFSEGCGDGAGYLSGPLGRVRVRVTRVGRGHVGLTLRERPARARPTRLHAPARTHEPFRPRRGLLLEGVLRAVRGRRERTGREAAAAKSSRLQSIGLHRNPTRPNKLHHNSRNKVPSTAHNRTKQQNSARASTRLSLLQLHLTNHSVSRCRPRPSRPRWSVYYRAPFSFSPSSPRSANLDRTAASGAPA